MHSRLEQYLQTVEQNLQALPAEERDNELSEIRLHIESLVEANRELGSTEEEAVTQTLAQFGHAQTLGRDLTQVHAWEGKPTFRALASVTAFNFLTGVLVSLVGMALKGLFDMPHFTSAVGTRVLWYPYGLLLTFGMGWLTGAVMPRHAVKGTLYSHLLWSGLSFLYTLALLFTGRLPASVLPILCTIQLISVVMSTSCAMLGAKLGARWRNKRKQMLRLARQG